jgi:hypothetical protein
VDWGGGGFAAAILIVGCQVDPHDVAGAGAELIEGDAGSPEVRDLATLQALSWDAAERNQRLMTTEERDRQDEAAQVLGARPGTLAVTWRPDGAIGSLGGLYVRLSSPAAIDADPETHARAFIDERAALFGLARGSTSLAFDRIVEHGGASAVEMTQTIAGLPVFESRLIVSVLPDGMISAVTARIVRDDVAVTPRPAIEVDEIVARTAGDRGSARLGLLDPEQVGSLVGRTGTVELVWQIEVPERRALVYVSASTGEELLVRSTVAHDAHREIFRCQGCSTAGLPGSLLYDTTCHSDGLATCPIACSAGQCQVAPPWPGSSATLADSVLAAENYWTAAHARHGWDDNQCATPGTCSAPMGVSYHRMRAAADFGSTAAAAFWYLHRDLPPSPERATVATGASSACLEVVQHEFTHGVMERGPNLQGETSNACGVGGLQSEGFSDVFGELTHLWQHGSADWIHGTGCPTVTGSRRTNLAEPSCYLAASCTSGAVGEPYCRPGVAPPPGSAARRQPDNWAYFDRRCGGHFNSTIISSIAHLLARDPAAPAVSRWGISTLGIGPVAARNVWYHALRSPHLIRSLASWRAQMVAGCVEHAPAGQLARCVDAVGSSGVWENDRYTFPWFSPRPRSFSFSRFTIDGQDRRYLFYSRAGSGGYQCYRYTTCPVRDDCTWSAETCYTQGTAELGPTTAVVPGANTQLVSCYVHRHTNTSSPGALFCDRFTPGGGGPLAGPDVASVNLAHEPSIAFHTGDNRLHVVYRKSSSSQIFWRTLVPPAVGGTWTWGAEQAITGASATGVGPVLAAGEGQLFMVYVTGGYVLYRRFASGAWGPEHHVFREDDRFTGSEPLRIPSDIRPAAAIFRGALTVAVNGNTLWSAVHEGSLSPTERIYVTSCRLPCDPAASVPSCENPEDTQQWSWLVEQESPGRVRHLSTDGSGHLQLWNQPYGWDIVAFRSRFSR